MRAVRRTARWSIDPACRARERSAQDEFLRFQRAFGGSLGCRLAPTASDRPKALLSSSGVVGSVRVDLGLIKGLELAGFEPMVLMWDNPWLTQYYRLAGVDNVYCWEDFTGHAETQAAQAAVERMRSSDELIQFQWAGIRVGRFAASTTLRQLRVGSLDLSEPEVRRHVTQRIAAGLLHARAAQRLIATVRPSVALFVDRGYTPQGELFDVCLEQGIDTITWNGSHKSNALILKRYSTENRDAHPASLSARTWEALRQMAWTPAHRERLQQELFQTYASGDWYSEVGTQFHTRLIEPEEVRRRLGLDPGKKTAVIFAHILWDGTFFWGRDLFGSYEEWLIETVRAACANPRVNWIIKVHPANQVKNVRDGVRGDYAEVIALRRAIGSLPPHIVVMPAESEINNYSLFPLIDYGVTVRGTIGIETASFGIPVLTAGTGRYDHRGFTIDSESPHEYLDRLRRIHELPPLLPAQRELAERFAYGVFVLRPFALKTLTFEFDIDARATPRTSIRAVTKADWLNAPDLRAFASWAADRRAEDFLMWPDQTTARPSAAVCAV